MKLNVEKKNVTKSENFEGRGFSIKQSKEAFEILSSSLYTNKVLAVAREIIANAMDASKNGRLPEIYIPDALDPTFKVRDFGKGLCHDDVMILYTTYFESTKAESNDDIGGFGLGSKAPFAYADSFTITSWHDGMKRIYSAFKGGDGCPQVNMLHEEETTEPGGLEVAVPVRREDFRSFQGCISQVLTHFPKLPKFRGATVAIDTPKYSFQAATGGYTKSAVRQAYGQAQAIMGNLAYPIVYSREFAEHMKACKLSSTLVGAVLQSSTNLFFDLGEISLAPSREGLSNSRETMEAVGRKAVAFVKDILKDIKTKLDAKSNDWDKALVYAEILQKNHYLRAIAHATKHFGGVLRPIPDIAFGSMSLKNEIDIITPSTKYNAKAGKTQVISSLYSSKNLSAENQSSYKNLFVHLETDEKVAKIRAWIRQNPADGASTSAFTSGILTDKNKNHAVIIFKGCSRASAIVDVKSLGLPEDVLLSSSSFTVQKITREKKGLEQHVDIYTDASGGWRDIRPSQHWDEHKKTDTLDFDAGGFYVPLHYGRILLDENNKDGALHPKALTTILGCLNLHNKKIYGVKTAKHTKFKDAKQWINLYEHAKVEAEEGLTEEFYEAMDAHNRGDEDTSRIAAAFKRLYSVDKAGPVMKKLIDQEDGKKKLDAKMKKVDKLARHMSVRRKARSVSRGINFGDLCIHFPMLKIANRGYDGIRTHINEVCDYIYTLDKEDEVFDK